MWLFLAPHPISVVPKAILWRSHYPLFLRSSSKSHAALSSENQPSNPLPPSWNGRTARTLILSYSFLFNKKTICMLWLVLFPFSWSLLNAELRWTSTCLLQLPMIVTLIVNQFLAGCLLFHPSRYSNLFTDPFNAFNFNVKPLKFVFFSWYSQR